MSPLPCNNSRGIGLIEVVIAIFLTTTAVLAVFSLQPTAWRTAARADYMGRAAGLLSEELQRQESLIMNPCNTVTTGTTGPTTVYASGQTTLQQGDIPFTITTTIAETSAGSSVWRVTVRVAWPNHTGIIDSIYATRQEGFRFPAGCS